VAQLLVVIPDRWLCWLPSIHSVRLPLALACLSISRVCGPSLSVNQLLAV
jgi:hypothetical protein